MHKNSKRQAPQEGNMLLIVMQAMAFHHGQSSGWAGPDVET